MLKDPVAFALIFMCAVVADIMLFDRLVGRERQVAASRWVADGQPAFFWPRRERQSVAQAASRNWLYYKWLFTTPGWTRKDSLAGRLQWARRGCWVLMVASLLAGIACS